MLTAAKCWTHRGLFCLVGTQVCTPPDDQATVKAALKDRQHRAAAAYSPTTSSTGLFYTPSSRSSFLQGPSPVPKPLRKKWQLPYLQLTQKQVRIVAVTHHNEPPKVEIRSLSCKAVDNVDNAEYEQRLLKMNKVWANHDKCVYAELHLHLYQWGKLVRELEETSFVYANFDCCSSSSFAVVSVMRERMVLLVRWP